MTLDAIKGTLPEYARDLKLNLGSLENEQVLTEQQRAGTFVAAALAARNSDLTRAVLEQMAARLAPAALNAAKAAAAIMGMNNVYYRFVHLAGNKAYGSLPAKLRMNVIGKPGVEQADFELWSLAVSAVNGCGLCIDAHEKVLREAGITEQQIQAAVRIAAVIHAVAAVLDGEAAAPIALPLAA